MPEQPKKLDPSEEICVTYPGLSKDKKLGDRVKKAMEEVGFLFQYEVTDASSKTNDMFFTHKDQVALQGEKVMCQKCFKQVDKGTVNEEGICLDCEAGITGVEMEQTLPEKTKRKKKKGQKIFDDALGLLRRVPVGAFVSLLQPDGRTDTFRKIASQVANPHSMVQGKLTGHIDLTKKEEKKDVDKKTTEEDKGKDTEGKRSKYEDDGEAFKC